MCVTSRSAGMQRCWLWLVSILPLSGQAQNCERVIELSKVVNAVVASREFVEQHAANFCREYGQAVERSASASFGASYEFLSSSLVGAHSSAEAIAGKFCSAANSSVANDDAYRQYIETISPNAYVAYEQCLLMSRQDLRFNVNPASFLASEFSMSASFVSSTDEPSAKVMYTSSKDVRCSWDGTDAVTREILSGSSAILKCERPDPSTRSYVTLVRSDRGSGQDSLTLPWQAYSQEGVPLDTLAGLSASMKAMQGRLGEIDIDYDRLQFQSGTLIMPNIPNSSRCAQDGASERGVINGRVDFVEPFNSKPIVTMGFSSINIRGNNPSDSNRLNLSLLNADSKGFNYSFTTWCSTVLYGASASWFAIAK
jgi:hypothetical protein